MVRHQPLQYYEPQLCLSCLTGIYGCRWKRYQRSHDDTTPVSCPGIRQGTWGTAVPGGRLSALSLCHGTPDKSMPLWVSIFPSLK